VFHLIGADHRLRAACCYSSALSETELGGTTRALAGHILAADGDSSAWPGGQGVSPATDDHIVATGRRSSAGLNWVTSLLDQLELEQPRIHDLSSRLIFHLLDALKDDAEVGARTSLVEAARSKLAWLHDQSADSAEYARDLSISYERLGDLYVRLGEPAGAGALPTGAGGPRGAAAAGPGQRRVCPGPVGELQQAGGPAGEFGGTGAGPGEESSRQEMSQRDGKELAVELHRFAAVIGQHAGSTGGRAVREGA
jgi:hypothetical protein